MHRSWSRGFTKETHPSVKKISETMKGRGLDNFKSWRDDMKKLGVIKNEYPALEKNGDLAELIGMILGDGYIAKFPRTDLLTIACNSEDIELIERYASIVKRVFDKQPTLPKMRKENCIQIKIYQKKIAERLGLPYSPKKDKEFPIPRWILKEKQYILRYLRGLYEAEGSFCVHLPTSTYKLLFSNRNDSLLKNVMYCLKLLGFHPHFSSHQVQLSRKAEVYAAKEMIQFRRY
jgi:DNA-binding transcriptional regulator WhiA